MLASTLVLAAAIVTTDQAVLRAAPRDSAPQQARLWQGELLELRGERLDYLQVWDHGRERGGYVKASQVKRMALAPAEAPELLSVLRFIREAPGAESLGHRPASIARAMRWRWPCSRWRAGASCGCSGCRAGPGPSTCCRSTRCSRRSSRRMRMRWGRSSAGRIRGGSGCR